jgi:uncharacterized protein YqeY
MDNQINQDLKAAMLSGDKRRVEVLKGIKNAMLYEAVSLNIKETGLNSEQAQTVLARESKKRAEAAEIYKKAGVAERAEAEIAEKAIIDIYLPKQLGETEILVAVKEEIKNLGALSLADMGRVIGAVKSHLGAAADGAVVAKLVKKELEQK